MADNLTWNGDAISARLKAAQVTGINQTMSACVIHAKRNHTWRNQTSVLEGGITLVDYATPAGAGVRGVWGVVDVRYALIQELGGVVKPVTAKALAIPLPDGGMAFAKSVTIPARPYLRPAADAEYPRLAGRIKRAYERGSPADV